MITKIENLAHSDLIIIHTSDNEKIIIERDGNDEVWVSVSNLASNKGPPYSKAYVLGKKDE